MRRVGLRIATGGATLNLLPLIDVMFSLLIVFIFLLTRMELSGAIPVELAHARGGAAGERAEKPIVLTVTREGGYYVDDSEVSAAELAGVLKRLGRVKKAVKLRADRNAAWEAVIKAIAAIRSVENLSLRLAVVPKEEGRSR